MKAAVVGKSTADILYLLQSNSGFIKPSPAYNPSRVRIEEESVAGFPLFVLPNEGTTRTDTTLPRLFTEQPPAVSLSNDELLRNDSGLLSLMPDEFFCAHSQKIMDHPVSLPYDIMTNNGAIIKAGAAMNGVEFLRQLAKNPKNPFTQKQMTAEDASPNTTLRRDIAAFMDFVVPVLAKKKKECGCERLSFEEYEAIVNAALNGLQGHYQSPRDASAASAKKMGK